MSGEYNKFLQEIHSTTITTDEAISGVVQEAVGSEILSKKRLMAGEVNEVYDVELESGTNIIVRIHKSAEQAFLQEKWAIDQCKLVGVPAPAIILIKHIPQTEGILSFCVQEKLKGDTVERGEVNMWDIDKDQLKEIMHTAGELLGKMHTIPVTGFGSLDEHGKAKHDSFVGKLAGGPERIKRFMDLSEVWGIPKNQMEKAMNLLQERALKFKDMKPTFNHGDFAPKHIMYDGSEVTGIIDFGDIQSSAPIFDFVRWEYWYGNNELLRWIKEGYPDKSIFDESYEEKSGLIQLNMALGTMWHYHSKQKYEKGVKDGIEKFNEILSRFK